MGALARTVLQENKSEGLLQSSYAKQSPYTRCIAWAATGAIPIPQGVLNLVPVPQGSLHVDETGLAVMDQRSSLGIELRGTRPGRSLLGSVICQGISHLPETLRGS